MSSDATPEVVRRQLDADPGPLSWHRLETTGARDAVAAAAEHILSGAVRPGRRGGWPRQ